MSEYILEMKHISKEFTGVKALDDVVLKIKRGEIHSICGENGAGKSTLMKVLSGVYPHGKYEGDIYLDGKMVEFKNTKESEEKGIVIIHQELELIPQLSIAENIFLGNEIAKNNIIDFDETYESAQLLMKLVGLTENSTTLVKDLGIGKQQLVEIAKALSKKVRLLILDEPTAALNENDSENLINLLRTFKKQGITSIMISHKLNEVMEISDSITILRDGKTIETLDNRDGQLTEQRIIKGMVGRELSNRYPEYTPKIREKYFEVDNWNVYHPIKRNKKIIHDANFYIRKGEIVGIAGLMGAGRTELIMSIFGKSYGTNISGIVKKDGKVIDTSDVNSAITNGLAYVSEDRKETGLVLGQDINKNISLASLEKISKSLVIDPDLEIEKSEYYREKLRIKSSSIFQTVGNLSGGNQQKVVLAKWMLSEPDVLFLDEPTRGIDVGAKYEIYKIIQEMAHQGKAICIVSSELPEILGMCDRIYTMNEGRLTSEVLRDEATQEILMKNMTSKVGI